jgi:hypothetical protein
VWLVAWDADARHNAAEAAWVDSLMAGRYEEEHELTDRSSRENFVAREMFRWSTLVTYTILSASADLLCLAKSKPGRGSVKAVVCWGDKRRRGWYYGGGRRPIPWH